MLSFVFETKKPIDTFLFVYIFAFKLFNVFRNMSERIIVLKR